MRPDVVVMSPLVEDSPVLLESPLIMLRPLPLPRPLVTDRPLIMLRPLTSDEVVSGRVAERIVARLASERREPRPVPRREDNSGAEHTDTLKAVTVPTK